MLHWGGPSPSLFSCNCRSSIRSNFEITLCTRRRESEGRGGPLLHVFLVLFRPDTSFGHDASFQSFDGVLLLISFGRDVGQRSVKESPYSWLCGWSAHDKGCMRRGIRRTPNALLPSDLAPRHTLISPRAVKHQDALPLRTLGTTWLPVTQHLLVYR